MWIKFVLGVIVSSSVSSLFCSQPVAYLQYMAKELVLHVVEFGDKKLFGSLSVSSKKIRNDLKNFDPEVFKKWYVTTLKPAVKYLPLIWAASRGHALAVSILHTCSEIDINEEDMEERTALSFCCSKGYKNIVELLLNLEGIDVNRADNIGITPLHYAAEKGHIEIVALLLGSEGIKRNQINDCGETPLDCAKKKGHTEIVKLLSKKKSSTSNSG